MKSLKLLNVLEWVFLKVKKTRPIRVKLYSTGALSSILRNAKDLKNSRNNKKTFLGPDRTLEERETHKQLVGEMKELIRNDPEKYYYIRGGTIVSSKRKTLVD